MNKYIKIAKIVFKYSWKYIEKATFEAKISPSFEEASH
jgi:hypothetical protein